MSILVPPNHQYISTIDLQQYQQQPQSQTQYANNLHQHVVPHLQHLQAQQLLRSVPDYNSPVPSTPPNLATTPNSLPISNSTQTTNNNTPATTTSLAPGANNINISSPITISNSSLNSPTNTGSPSLINNGKRMMLTQQSCLVEEKFSKNGVQKNVHVVVKNNPFILIISLLDPSLNFHQLTPEVQLVYDSESLKEVDSATVKPLEYKTRANEEGDQLTIELRIKVLSSQLEDMLFRAKVKIIDPRTRKDLPGLSVITHPIRVVSKPDQVKKKAKKRKRAPTDSLMDTLNRIEHQQKEQQRLLKKLCSYDKDNNIKLGDLIPNQNFNNEQEQISGSNSTSETTGDTDEFQDAFKEFISAFKQLQCLDPDGADVAFKINTCANDAQTMCEILELVKTELKKDQQFMKEKNVNNQQHGEDCLCSCKSCPYKHKVDLINQSYESYLNIFNNGSNSNGSPTQQAQQQQTPTNQLSLPSNTSNSSLVPQVDYEQQQFNPQQISNSNTSNPTQINQLSIQQQQFLQQQAVQQQQQQFYLQQLQLQQQAAVQQQRYLIQTQQLAAQQAALSYQTQQPQQPLNPLDQFTNQFLDYNANFGLPNMFDFGFTGV